MSNRNATASWSGYSHQGKVGILIALQKINELIEGYDSSEINDFLSDWSIEYEGAEDFDVKYNNKVISRHQVKAYKDAKYPNDYKDVLTGFDVNQVNRNSRFLHTITETKGFGLPENEFVEIYPPPIKYIDNPKGIQLYRYPDNNLFCDLSSNENKLKDFCLSEIKKLLIKNNHFFKNFGKIHEEKLFILIDLLDEKIRIAHQLGNQHTPILSFLNINEILLSTDDQIRNNISSVREEFINSFHHFIEELSIDSIPYDTEHFLLVTEKIKEIYLLEDNIFEQFIKDINPDQNNINDFETSADMIKLCDINSFKDIFFKCLTQVTNKDFNKKIIGYHEDGGYLLTLINRDQANIKSVVNAMISNKKVTQDIFDRQFLINKNISGEQIGFHTDKKIYNNLSKNWGDNVTESDKFFNPEMEFISVDNAIIKLNEG